MTKSLPLQGIEGLSEDDSAQLQTMFDECVKREAVALRTAIDGGMNNIPRLLRGPVKSMLFR